MTAPQRWDDEATTTHGSAERATELAELQAKYDEKRRRRTSNSAEQIERWQPDEQMLAAVLASPRAWLGMTRLCDADRAWLVGWLTEDAGMTAERIAERLDCSLRLVRTIRADDMTQMAVIAIRQTRALHAELHAERSESALLRRDLVDARNDHARMVRQRDDMVKALGKGQPVATCPQKHPLVGGNLYRHDGRRKCRECNRIRVAGIRRAEREASQSAEQDCNPPGRTKFHPQVVTSAP